MGLSVDEELRRVTTGSRRTKLEREFSHPLARLDGHLELVFSAIKNESQVFVRVRAAHLEAKA